MNSCEKLADYLSNQAVKKKSPAGKEYKGIDIATTKAIAGLFKICTKEVEIVALTHGVIPDRYERNLGTIGIKGQISLLNSRVAVVGLGGLGGFTTELLARLGLGNLALVDGDVFTESNLNRQVCCTEESLGKSKAVEAAGRVKIINQAVDVRVYSVYGDEQNLPGILEGCDVVVDCLDTLTARFTLEKVCQALKVPMVHGAIAGTAGQMTVIYPGSPVMEIIYGKNPSEFTQESCNIKENLVSGKEVQKTIKEGTRGIETILGNPAQTPALIAAWQVNELVKLITKQGDPLSGCLMFIDIWQGEVWKVPLGR